jgi:hypothetical protein
MCTIVRHLSQAMFVVATLAFPGLAIAQASSDCAADADCSQAHHDCGTVMSQDCSGATCKADQSDQECADATKDQCVPVEIRVCVPHWEKICTSTSDCRAGFECVPQQCQSAGACAGQGLCRLIDSSCGRHADCPDRWSCVDGQCVVPVPEGTPSLPAAPGAQEDDLSAPAAVARDDRATSRDDAGCTLSRAQGTPSPVSLLVGSGLLLAVARRFLRQR